GRLVNMTAGRGPKRTRHHCVLPENNARSGKILMDPNANRDCPTSSNSPNAMRNKDTQMDHNMAVRLLGGVYIALAYAMPDEAHRLPHDILMGFADNPDVRPEDRRAYRLIALTGGRQDLAEEDEQPQYRLEVITGGAA